MFYTSGYGLNMTMSHNITYYVIVLTLLACGIRFSNL